MTMKISTRLAVEIEKALGEIVDNERAGWGDEPYIECLYCGNPDKLPDGSSGSHSVDCPILRGRTLRVMLKAAIEYE